MIARLFERLDAVSGQVGYGDQSCRALCELSSKRSSAANLFHASYSMLDPARELISAKTGLCSDILRVGDSRPQELP